MVIGYTEAEAQVACVLTGAHARTGGRSWAETQTRASQTARAPTVAQAPALTLPVGPGTGLALSLTARKISAVPDEPPKNGNEAARVQRTKQIDLRRRDV